MVPEGYKWVHCRPTEVQKTTRPDTICLEEWSRWPKKQQKEEMGWISKNAWLRQCPVFLKLNVRGNPTLRVPATVRNSNDNRLKTKDIYVAEKGCVSEFHYGLAHKPIFRQRKAAVDKEWNKLKNL